MQIMLASIKEMVEVMRYDRHISKERLHACLEQGQVYTLYVDEKMIGVLRYSFFWQQIPFIDLLYIDPAYQGKGYGRKMMKQFEKDMHRSGFRYIMLSTQEDETAKYFYEKLSYHLAGSFFPPEQESAEEIYWKILM